tara:strand:- start:212 stop:622 length:411 start_codon:yes stop_codon:yes gene_type:complete
MIMRKIDKQSLVESMRKRYYQRLLEVLDETDVKDKRGNVVIQPGLKVRHSKSQYEYTVADVQENPENGEVQITLQAPEEPRFEPSASGDVIREDDSLQPPEEEMPVQPQSDLSDPPEDADVFVVDEKEFEKDYEVK